MLSGQQGFTLMELMVVTLIIGVLAVAISLSSGGRAVEDRMEADAKRVERLLRLASDEALAKGIELGMRQTTEGFDFLTPDPQSGQWSVIRDGMFRPRQISGPFELELRIEGRLIKPVEALEFDADSDEDNFENEASKKKEGPAIEPVILILSTGEMTPFLLDLKLPGKAAYYQIEGNILGQIMTTRQEEKFS
tara:strand:- start:976 stop:1554 length:579 start_codon:yes stop_codon:yes gene_type:complete